MSTIASFYSISLRYPHTITVATFIKSIYICTFTFISTFIPMIFSFHYCKDSPFSPFTSMTAIMHSPLYLPSFIIMIYDYDYHWYCIMRGITWLLPYNLFFILISISNFICLLMIFLHLLLWFFNNYVLLLYFTTCPIHWLLRWLPIYSYHDCYHYVSFSPAYLRWCNYLLITTPPLQLLWLWLLSSLSLSLTFLLSL